jgi:hypothetical protein
MKTFNYEGLKAEQHNDTVTISKNGESLVTIDHLNNSATGNPRYKITSHVAQGLPRLARTYRQVKNAQFMEWFGNFEALTDTVMIALLDSNWNS